MTGLQVVVTVLVIGLIVAALAYTLPRLTTIRHGRVVGCDPDQPDRWCATCRTRYRARCLCDRPATHTVTIPNDGTYHMCGLCADDARRYMGAVDAIR